MKTAEVALLVSIFSTFLSVCALGWNITAFVRSGPKVKASMAMGTQRAEFDGAGRGTATVSTKAWSQLSSFRSRADQHFFVTATNIGRAAIWVDSVGLCSSTAATSFNVVVAPGEKDLGFGPSLPFKLDAGQTVRWALPIGNAGLLCRVGDVPDSECVHGQVVLGSGATLRTKEGIRVGLLRDHAEV